MAFKQMPTLEELKPIFAMMPASVIWVMEGPVWGVMVRDMMFCF